VKATPRRLPRAIVAPDLMPGDDAAQALAAYYSPVEQLARYLAHPSIPRMPKTEPKTPCGPLLKDLNTMPEAERAAWEARRLQTTVDDVLRKLLASKRARAAVGLDRQRRGPKAATRRAQAMCAEVARLSLQIKRPLAMNLVAGAFDVSEKTVARNCERWGDEDFRADGVADYIKQLKAAKKL
jgi:hypothetical protein